MRPPPDPPPGPPSPPPLLPAALAAWHADPTTPVLTWAGGGEPCCAANLASALASFTTLLVQAGVPAGSPSDSSSPPPLVGLYLGSGPAWVVAALGCWGGGCAFACLDPGWAPGVAAAATAHLNLAAVAWAEAREDTPGGSGLPNWAVSVPLIQLPPGFPAKSSSSQTPPAWWPAPPPTPFCYALPTSGTTTSTTPRFVLGTWDGVSARAAWGVRDLGVGTGDCVACLARPTAVDALSATLLPLLSGARVVCADPGDAGAVAHALAQATTLTTTPSTWAGLLAGGEKNEASSPFPALRLAISSGEPLPRRLAVAIAAALPAEAVFLNVYGLTEAAGDSTAADMRAWLEEESHGDSPSSTTAPAGFSVAGAAVWVTRDAGDAGLPPAAPGEEGIVAIAGPGVAAGYSGGEETGSTRFVSAADGARAVLTGDRGFLGHTGSLHLCGRADRVVKGAGGGRVDLDAVEAAVVGGCARVAAAAALALPGVASVGLAVAGEGLTAEAVRGWASTALPPAALPGALLILPALPLQAPGGKIDRRALAEALQKTTPAAPRRPTPGEAAVAAAMAAVLARRREVESGEGAFSKTSFEATTDFLAAGGDSLDAAAVAARLGGGATPELILAGRTARGIARLLAGGGHPQPAALTLPLLAASQPPTAGWRALWRVPVRGCVDAPPTLLSFGYVLATSHAGDAVCVEAATGRVVWTAEVGVAADEGAAALTRDGSRVAVSLSSGGLAILDAATGGLACSIVSLDGSPRGPPAPDASGWWVGTREGGLVRVGKGGEAMARLHAGTRLVGAPVFAPGGGSTAFLVGTGPDGATLLRLDASTATIAPLVGPGWSLAPGAPPGSAPPVIVGSLVILVDTAGHAAGFDTATGALAWRVGLGGPVAAAPAVTPTTLIFPIRTNPGLVALDAGTGARLWEAALPGDTGAASTPALLAESTVVVAIAADSGSVCAFSTSTGALLGAARLPDAAYGGATALSPTLIACGCRDDAVWGLEFSVIG